MSCPENGPRGSTLLPREEPHLANRQALLSVGVKDDRARFLLSDGRIITVYSVVDENIGSRLEVVVYQPYQKALEEEIWNA